LYRTIFDLELTLQKKRIFKNDFFCDGGVFFLDRGLLMGASTANSHLLWICYAYLQDIPPIKIADYVN